jgi:hypothetical protein
MRHFSIVMAEKARPARDADHGQVVLGLFALGHDARAGIVGRIGVLDLDRECRLPTRGR